MTIKTYKRIGNISFVLAIAAVLSFDTFTTPLIPGLVLVGAGALALGINVLARFKPLDEPASASEGSPTAHVAPYGPSPTIRVTGIDRRRHEQNLGEQAECEQAEREQTTSELSKRLLAAKGFYDTATWAIKKDDYTAGLEREQIRLLLNVERRYMWQYRLENARQTAIDVARALNPEPTEYEVILTSDGTLRISPKARLAQGEPQRPNLRRPIGSVEFHSKLVH